MPRIRLPVPASQPLPAAGPDCLEGPADAPVSAATRGGRGGGARKKHRRMAGSRRLTMAIAGRDAGGRPLELGRGLDHTMRAADTTRVRGRSSEVREGHRAYCAARALWDRPNPVRRERRCSGVAPTCSRPRRGARVGARRAALAYKCKPGAPLKPLSRGQR